MYSTSGLFCLLLASFSYGCSAEAEPSSTVSPTKEPTTSVDDTTPFEPDLLTDITGASCHSLANTAPLVTEEKRAAEARPPFEGGTLAEGLYYRVQTIRYTSEATDSAVKERQTVRVQPGGIAEVVHANEGDADDPTTFTFVTKGNEIEFSVTCPTKHVNKTLYTATPTEFRIARGEDGVIVYRRQ